MNHEEYVKKVLNEIKNGVEPNQKDYDLDKEQWGEVAEIIRDANLAEGVTVQRGGIGNKVVFAWYSNPRITLTGLEYLKRLE